MKGVELYSLELRSLIQRLEGSNLKFDIKNSQAREDNSSIRREKLMITGSVFILLLLLLCIAMEASTTLIRIYPLYSLFSMCTPAKSFKYCGAIGKDKISLLIIPLGKKNCNFSILVTRELHARTESKNHKLASARLLCLDLVQFVTY